MEDNKRPVLGRFVVLDIPSGLLPARDVFVYVSGQLTAPFGPMQEKHVQDALLVGMAVIEAGFSPYIPHTNNCFEQGFLEWENYLEIDTLLIERLWMGTVNPSIPKAAICMIGEWSRSPGAKVELQKAVDLQMPIMYARLLDQEARDY